MPIKTLVYTLLNQSPPPDEALLDALIIQSDAIILGYLGLHSFPDMDLLNPARAALAVILFNRLGAEGETARKEGEVDSRFEALPLSIKTQLRPYRRAFLPLHTPPKT